MGSFQYASTDSGEYAFAFETEEDFAAAISARIRKRLIRGLFESGEDVAALRRFVPDAVRQGSWHKRTYPS